MKRGQATTELALSSLVFVTVLLFGIHFAEAGHAMLKTKEAAAFALTHASGERTHSFTLSNVTSGNTFAPFAPAASGAVAQARYGAGWSGVLTQVEGTRVSCRADDTVSFEVQRPGGLTPNSNAALSYLRGVYRDRGGVSCTARGTLSLFRVPSSFAEGGDGFFKEQHAKLADLPVCGAGMPKNGNCPGRLATLTGDWAYEGRIGSALNADNPDVRQGVVNNPSYREVVENLFDLAGGPYSNPAGGGSGPPTPAQELMRIGGGVTPAQPEWIDETKFSMSYRGDVSGPQVRIPRHAVDPPYNPLLEYQTSGADLDNSLVRWNDNTGVVSGVPRCFMGLYGCQQNPLNPYP